MIMEQEMARTGEEPQQGASTGSPVKVISPIRIKISLGASGGAKKNESIKINLGELVRNSKSKRSSDESRSSSSPVLA